MSTIALRIFSGLHAGAEMELTDGAWTIGSGDSCDIVLSDAGLLERHAVIEVAQGRAEMKPLDGVVERVPGEASGAAELFRLGPVLLAWAPRAEAEAAWQAVSASLQSAAAALVEKRTQPDAETEAREADAHEGEKLAKREAPASEAQDAEGSAEDGDSQAEASQRSTSSRTGFAVLAVVVLAAALLAGGLSVKSVRTQAQNWLSAAGAEGAAAALDSLFGTEREEGEAQAQLESLKKTLAELNLPGISTSLGADGACCLIQGWVADDAERGAVLAAARRLPAPVVLQIKVATDYTAGPAAALRREGFWPAVGFIPASSAASPDAIHIEGYMESPQVEKAALAKASDAWPVDALGRRLQADCRILYRSDVEKLFQKHLPKTLRGKVRTVYLPGSIRLEGSWREKDRSLLEQSIAAVRRDAGVPLRIALAESEPTSAAEPMPKITAAASDKRSAAPSFRVAAVSGGTIKFITLASGEKVFAGGKLPGGFALEEIGHDKLVLSKDNQRINFPLRLSK